MGLTPAGKLELTWTNKNLRLLSDEDGGYTWVEPSDYRVAEVRLLHDVEEVGETHGVRSRAKDNLLVRGDALSALTSLCELPEFAREYVGKVKLAYLDPPFNTQQAFEHYDDALEHSVWLTMMRDRLLQIRTLLSPDGSVWVHCDDSEQAYLKVMMDEVFGRDSFIAVVVWQKRPTRENRAAIGSAHDYLIVYSPLGARWSDVRKRLPRDEKSLKQYRNQNDDPRGPWRLVPLDAQGFRPNQMYDIVGPTGKVFRPPKDRCWGMLEERYRALDAAGRISFGKTGESRPMIIRYLDEDQGLVPWTWWPATEVGHTGESKREIMALFPDVEAFGTPKPERLMHRIIHIASTPGEVVLDCFAGSGTTAAVAHKMGRRWVTVEMSADTVETFTRQRLEKVVAGDDPGGVTEQTGWLGGGGFRFLEVAASMFAEVGGRVWLAEWAVDRELAEATAAQLGFDFEPEPPFAGRKGRTRLAVVDGLVSPDVVELLVGALGPDEKLVLCGTAVDPEATERLRELSRGSRTRKIPASILAEYRLAREWRTAEAPAPEPEPVA
jgi:adenine-specific DNA-methyltransferase